MTDIIIPRYIVGPGGAQADGTELNARAGKTGDLITSELHGDFRELASRAGLYFAQTAASGVAPGTSVGTTAAFALYNPGTSGKQLNLVALSMGYVSGTLGAGYVGLIGHTSASQAAFTGTAITPVNALIGGSGTAVGQAFTTATVPSGGKNLLPLWSLGASLASTAIAPWVTYWLADGMVEIAQGGGISIQGTAAAGTSPLVVFGAVWEEIAV